MGHVGDLAWLYRRLSARVCWVSLAPSKRIKSKRGPHESLVPPELFLGMIKSSRAQCKGPRGHYRNVRGLGKSMVVFRLFEKL